MENQYDLNQALARCRQSALRGYEIADAQLGEIERVLRLARRETEQSVRKLSGRSAYLSDLNHTLARQIKDIAHAFDKVSDSSREELRQLKNNLSRFNITLFGRTMAGKSTLMEVLTHGDGRAIGNGSQRKTRDIRAYEWNGLSITDVPGIGAFEGQKDEDIAFAAAKSADMILFLMTDDGVQSQEAECFRSILELGKPVLCVINVKASVDLSEEPRYLTEDIEEAFRLDRLNEIRRQFVAYGSLAGQDWSAVPFVFAHLRAAFLAQQTTDPVKQQLLTKASRIDLLTDAIAKRVATRGEFYREKTFIDAVSAPVGSATELLLEQSCRNSLQGEMIADKLQALLRWIERFEKSAYDRIVSETAELKSQMYVEASDFASRNLGSKELNAKWQDYLSSLKLDKRGKELVRELNEETEGEIRELTRAMGKELDFAVSYSTDVTLKSRRILDVRQTFDWSMIAIGGGLTIAALVFTPAAPILLLAALGVGLLKEFVGGFIPDKSKLEAGAKAEIEEQLRQHINEVCASYRASLEKSLRELLDKLNQLAEDLSGVSEVIAGLAATQNSLAWQLGGTLKKLYRQLLQEALTLIGSGSLSMRIHDAAMVPGAECAVVLAPNVTFPEGKRQALSDLLGCRVLFYIYSDDRLALLRKMLGTDAFTVREGAGGVMTAVLKKSDNPYFVNRAKLAQQLCEILITKE